MWHHHCFHHHSVLSNSPSLKPPHDTGSMQSPDLQNETIYSLCTFETRGDSDGLPMPKQMDHENGTTHTDALKCWIGSRSTFVLCTALLTGRLSLSDVLELAIHV